MDALSMCCFLVTLILSGGFLGVQARQEVSQRFCCSCGRRLQVATRVVWWRDAYCHKCYCHAVHAHEKRV
jgi:hypothetical protein